MRILRNYILRDFLSALFFSLLALTLVMILGNLGKISDMIIRKGVSAVDAFKILSLFIPYVLGFTIPLSILMGVLLAMGRLVADNELTAINVSGISLSRIITVFLTIGVISSLFLFLINDKIIPYFHYNYRSYVKNIYSKNITAIIEPGVYLENFKDTILYVDDIKDNKLKNVFVYEINKEGLSRLTYAKYGEFVVDKNILKMRLENGFRDEINPKNTKEFYRLNFKIFFIDIPVENKVKSQVNKKASDMNIKELKTKIKYLRNKDINPIEFIAELHKRISFAFSPIIFVILGFGVSLVVKHRERSINFGIAILVAGIYYLLMLLGETITKFQFVPPMFGMWLPNIVVGAIGLYLIIKHAHIR